MRLALPACLIAVAALAAQVPGIAGAWNVDDADLLVRNDLYTDPARLSEALSVPLAYGTAWRPLGTTSLLAGAMAHGLDAAAFRATSAVLHAVTAALVFVVLARFLRSRGAAALAALAWALHPAHVETVTWISARFDVQAGLFGALALLAAGDGSDTRIARRIGVALATFAACLSKESAFLLVALVPLWAAAAADPLPGTARASLRARLPLALAALIGAAAAWFLRYEMTGTLLATRPDAAGATDGPLEHLLLAGRAVLAYAEILLVPWGSAGPAHHVARPVAAGDLGAWCGLAVLAAVVLGTVRALRSRPRTGLLAAALVVSLLPFLQIVPLGLAGGAVAADRLVYLPALFLAALVADGCVTLVAARPGARVPVAAAAGALAASFAVARILVLPLWTDPVRFWGWAAEGAPDVAFVRSRHAGALLAAGDLIHADSEARAGAEEFPVQLAEVLIARGRPLDALQVLDAAVQRGKAGLDVHLLRARLRLVHGGNPMGAFEDSEHVLKLAPAPEKWFPHVRAAAMALRAHAVHEGQDLRAREFLKDAESAADPRDAVAWLLIADAARAMRLPDRAVAAAGRARAAGADPVESLRIAGEALHGAARNAEASARFREILTLRPRDPVWLDWLAYTLYETGDVLGAESNLREALRIDPSFAKARFHFATLLSKTGRVEEARTQARQAALDLAANPDAALSTHVEALRRRIGE